MKLALYLLSCCIAASWQQNPQFWSPYRVGRPSAAALPYGYLQQPGPYYPAHNDYSPAYYNRFYFPAAAYYQQQQYVAAQKAQAANEQDKKAELVARLLLAQRLASLHQESQDHEDKDGDVAARVSLKTKEEDLEPRSFLFPALFYKAQIHQTSTKYSFITSTITSTSVISCIEAASFYGGSSQSCRRRRDHIEALRAISQEETSDGSLVNPSPVESVETTALPSQPIPRAVEVSPSMAQAKDDDSSLLDRLRLYLANSGSNPNARSGLFGSTTTSTVTTYSIITSATKKTVKIGSNLSCLPSNYSVC